MSKNKPKPYKKRDNVNEIGRQNMSNSQKEYRIKVRQNQYPNFPFQILSENRNFLIKDFCIHGNLKISPNDFNITYNNENKLNFYCDKCKETYLNKYELTNEIKIQNKIIINELYKCPSKLKINYIKVRYPYLYKEILQNSFIDLPWIEKTFLFKENLQYRPKCLSCDNETYFSHTNQRYTSFCKNHLGSFTSKGEIELKEFISNIEKDNYKLRLNGLELDIYVPKFKLAFEFNGLYWHNELYKTKNYHYDKWKICNNNNIQLITIWQDDWNYKKDIIKSIILNKLNQNDNKIYARKCIIKDVSIKESSLFLENNHLQGQCSSSTKLGLYFNNELVSLMTFGKRNIGRKTQFELLRFCNKLNTSVIGGASKLFKYFIKNYNSEKIISYASCDISNGELYKTLGFNEMGHTDPNFWWSDNNLKYHRSKFMKFKIMNDENKEETGSKIMNKKGYYKIYGTGNLKFEYINKK